MYSPSLLPTDKTKGGAGLGLWTEFCVSTRQFRNQAEAASTVFLGCKGTCLLVCLTIMLPRQSDYDTRLLSLLLEIYMIKFLHNSDELK